MVHIYQEKLEILFFFLNGESMHEQNTFKRTYGWKNPDI